MEVATSNASERETSLKSRVFVEPGKDSWTHVALEQPRQLWVRKALFQMHLWTGLTIGLLALVMGLTGSAIVFRGELDAKLSPALYLTDAAKASEPDIDKMLAAVQGYLPGRAIESASPADTGIWIFQVGALHPVRGKRDGTLVFVDPATDRVLGDRGERDGLINTLAYLHIELLSGTKGRTINGISASLLLCLSISGVLLWWPGRTRWRGAMKIRFGARWPRLNWDIHTAGGFFASIFIMLQATTALYLCFTFVAPLISRITGGHADDFDKLFTPPSSVASVQSTPLPIQPLLKRALDTCPGCKVRFVTFPSNPTDSVGFFLSPVGGERTTRFILDYFDRNDGHHLRRVDTADAPRGVRWMLFFTALHFGLWGGLCTRILWLFVGLTPGTLFVSGFLMWWRRVTNRS